MRVCLAVTGHLHFWQNDQNLVCATAVTLGWNGYQNKEPAQKVDPGQENSSATLAGTQHESVAVATELSLLPGHDPWVQTKGWNSDFTTFFSLTVTLLSFFTTSSPCA